MCRVRRACRVLLSRSHQRGQGSLSLIPLGSLWISLVSRVPWFDFWLMIYFPKALLSFFLIRDGFEQIACFFLRWGRGGQRRSSTPTAKAMFENLALANTHTKIVLCFSLIIQSYDFPQMEMKRCESIL